MIFGSYPCDIAYNKDKQWNILSKYGLKQLLKQKGLSRNQFGTKKPKSLYNSKKK